MSKFKHFLAHLFGTNYGEVVTWWDIDALMCGFQCADCGKVSGAHMIGVYVYGGPKPEFKWLIQGVGCD